MVLWCCGGASLRHIEEDRLIDPRLGLQKIAVKDLTIQACRRTNIDHRKVTPRFTITPVEDPCFEDDDDDGNSSSRGAGGMLVPSGQLIPTARYIPRVLDENIHYSTTCDLI